MRNRVRAGIAMATAVLLLSGCAGAIRNQAPRAYHDLGEVRQGLGRSARPTFPLRNLDVVAPSWLDNTAMQYRLAYDSDTRRRNYTESRWVAPPPDLVQQALRRMVVASGTEVPAGGCRLRVDLDEFVQVFEAPAQSETRLEARAVLLAPRTERLLARKGFRIREAGAGADAAGGAKAHAAGVRQLAVELRDWLAELDQAGQGAPCHGDAGVRE